jgi:SecD/SecF fusion protein
MQNKSALLVFTVLLSLTTAYVLSLSWASRSFEKKARAYALTFEDSLSGIYSGIRLDSAITAIERSYLRDSANASAYPIIGKSYKQVKAQELSLGLDLRGGMSVTLEVSIPDLVIALSDYNTNSSFRTAVANAKAAQVKSQDDFISLFEKEWRALETEKDQLWRIFHHLDSREKFPANATDSEVIATLRDEADAAINNSENVIRRRITRFGVAQPNVQKQSNTGRILVELPGVDDQERVRQQLKATANLEFWETYTNSEVAPYWQAANVALSQALYPEWFAAERADSLRTMQQVQDSIQALEVSQQIEDAKRRYPISYKMAPFGQEPRSPIIGYFLETDTTEINRALNHPAAKALFPPDFMPLWAAEARDGILPLYAIRDFSGKGKPKLDGKSITNSFQDYDQYGDIVVSMSMDGQGANIWAQMTRQAASEGNKAVAIVMDNLVYSAPYVNEEISGGRSQISMGSGNLEQKIKDAEDLVGLLKAGALPAPTKIVDESVVGPSLGAENIKSGLTSFLIALIVVLLYMVFYYKGAGLVSNLALLANLFFLIGALASMGATLTLPGIAGIVLTIGMAVDANVLIFERIREEMRQGRSLASALKDGYQKAYSAIIDANITTMLTAIILFIFGSGPIQGFAVVLMIGICTSLFSAILLTRLVFFTRLENKKSISFYSEMTKNWFTNTTIDFIGKRKMAYMISGAVIVLGVGSLFVRSLNYGVDFEGGRSYRVIFDDKVDAQNIREALAVAFTDESGRGNPEVKTINTSGREFKVVTSFMITSEDVDADAKVRAALDSGLSKVNVKYEVGESQKVDPSISDDFRRSATYATIFSLIVIFLYIFLRFRKWQYGAGAVVAMAHDVMVVIGLFSLLHGVLPFSLEVDQAFIAAILTVIGYSVNDTVVVFDRIREYLREHGKGSNSIKVMNNALNSTLSRTLNTSMTTFVVLLTIFLFGGPTIKGFTFALMVGVLVGTYSSLFIATPLVVDLDKKELEH